VSASEDKAGIDLGAGASAAPTDAQLVQRVLGGEREQFDELIRRYQRRAHAVSYRLLGDAHDAAEVTQDAFLKAYKSLGTLDSAEKFGGWLMRIVSNLSLNRRRSRKKSAPLPEDDLLREQESTGGEHHTQTGRAEDPYQQLAGQELGERLRMAIESLPEKQRLAIELFTIQQMPQKEVAEAMECSVEAVKWHVFEGRRKLREMLQDLLSER